MSKSKSHTQAISLRLVVLYKVILGLVEIILGTIFVVFALGVQSVATGGFIQKIMAKELGEDPNDIFLHWLLTYNLPFPMRTALHLSLLLVIFGIIKLIIAYGIWQHSHRVKLMTIALVLIMGLVGTIETIHVFSWFKVLATAVDFMLLYYLVFVLPQHTMPTANQAIDSLNH